MTPFLVYDILFMGDFMDLLEAISKRHSVRQYLDKEIENDKIEILESEIKLCNSESGLNIQLLVNEPKAFDTTLAHYGLFHGVKNYIALVGKKSDVLDELCGYYGQRIVLKAQQLGLNTCWVALISQFNEGIIKALIQGELGIYKGAIYENIAAQLSKQYQKVSYYFEPNTSSEIDFIIYYEGNIIKAGKNTKSTSFNHLIEKNKPVTAIRFSNKNISYKDQVLLQWNSY